MKAGCSRVKLGELLVRNSEPVTPIAGTRYQEITVKLWGRGVVLRGPVEGSSITGQRRFSARAGSFILSKIDARHGAMGIVPEHLNGALVSSDFPLYDVIETRINAHYLSWLCKTPSFIESCDLVSSGSTNRVRLKEDRFLDIEVLLPSLPEQHSIIEKLDAVSKNIEEIAKLYEEVDVEIINICRSLILSDTACKPTPMSSLVRLRVPDVFVESMERYKFAGVYCFGRGVFRGQQKIGMDFSYARLTRLREGDFTYPKLMAWEGAFGVVPKECDGCVVSTEYPVFEVMRDRVLPEVLDVYFRMPEAWEPVAGKSSGTNVRRRRLNPKDFLAFEFPLPSMKTQEKIRRVLEVEQGSRLLRTQAREELNALLPSVLDRVFTSRPA